MVDAGLINSDELYLVEGEEGITYTFADGTAGNFTVTPSNGEAQTVSVGLSNVTNHQQVHDVAWDKTNKKITRSKNGTAGDVVQFVQGDNITLTAADGKLTIASSFTNSRDPGYGKIKPGAASTAVTGITANTTSAEASTYNETLTINPGNKWIQLAGSNSSTAGSDALTIGHALSGVTAGTTSPNTAQTPGFNSTFNIPTVTFDAAGHITSTGTTTVKIPAETALSGGSAAANDATVAGGVTVSGHAVTVAKKTLTAGGGIKITGATDKVTIAHSNTSITAKTAAAQSAKTLTWGGTFTLYEEKYDAYGHITGVASYNMTMPANPNTDEKIKQNLTSENASYKLLTTTTASPTSGTAYEANYSTNLAYNPSENKLSTGNLDLTGELDVVGNANLHNQANIDSATVGSLLVNGSANFNQIPTAPTAAAGTSNTQLATTEFVTNATSGLSSAMHFIGKATVAITDGSTTNPSISGYDFTSDRKPGDVIIDKDDAYEYVWTIAGAWERLGPDSSYKVLQTPVTDPTANGSTTAFISSIAQDANGNITVAKKDLDTSGTWSGTAVKATQDGSGNNIADTYVKKSGDTMTGSLTLTGGQNQSSAWNDKGILFANGARIGENSNGALGLYSAERFYLRPNSGTASSGKGIEIDNTSIIPSVNNEMSLGNASHKWTTVYAAAFNGNGSALTDLNASNLASGTVAFDRLPSIYWANLTATNAASYSTAPEMASIKLNGNTSATAASTKNVVLQYDSSLEVLNFVFT